MITVTVTDITTETASVKRFSLRRSNGAPFASYAAGAHVDVTGPGGITRQYSLCGPPHRTDSYQIAVKREDCSRGGSAALHDQVAVGDELTISEPRNLFALAPEADTHVLVAAGIGITPLLSMAYQLSTDGVPYRLHYFASRREQAAFVRVLEDEGFASSVEFHFGIDRSEQPDVLESILAGAEPGAHVYSCGPKEFMQRVVEVATRSLPDDQVHIEHFQPLEPTTHDGGEFEVELDTGEVFAIPSGRSIVEVLGDAGIDVDTSCREGICGTCVLTVLDGVPDHRDNCLTRKEKESGDQIATCVSRAKTARLVLEL
ncbi:vanillate O-demethylase oxidoreductase [Rhodococcus opacus PD630]|uniref:PDR/VanB family oxidoreductase n=1 Tax=Rhodococcus opacus TaxID=37919 RepID=UPI00029CB0F3|nr:PDR/VanB family oxidoreductase [Rhodococcus opacus]AHK34410.1 Vanillate O-demethylase oxidoreductase [Rhodococcus opacus PD630]EHI39686.1 vanillate O-demethylase oxidoreductase [Rhodococcus opacus PD630]UDG96568.1 PDR/VanB family oxidoreductase [Rhodococcus opacus PD630]